MQTSPTQIQNCGLRLAAHARACAIDDQVILLDLRTNRYKGVSGAASSVLEQCVEGWPTRSPAGTPSSEEATKTGLTRQLLSQGLLTDRGPHFSKSSCVAPLIVEPMASLDLADLAMRSSSGVRHLAGFLNCATRTAWWLRCRSLHSIALTIASRREPSKTNTGSDELAQMKQCAVAYERLRPLLVTAREKCLFDSLALMNFLALEKLFPQWIIGVKTSPFGAHSWVQAGATVLNDQHEYVRRFRPILIA